MAGVEVAALTTEPIFYGSHKRPIEAALTAEDFLHRSDAIRTARHLADDDAIRRTVGNLRGEAYSWWKNALRTDDPDIDAARLQNEWDYFSGRFRKRFFTVKDRWDASTSYLNVRQAPNQAITEFAQEVLDRFNEDSALLLADADAKLTATHADPMTGVPAAAAAWIGALTNEQRGWYLAHLNTHATRAFKAMAACLTETEVARCVSLNAHDGRMRVGMKEKLKERFTITRLFEFLQQKEDLLKGRTPGLQQNQQQQQQGQRGGKKRDVKIAALAGDSHPERLNEETEEPTEGTDDNSTSCAGVGGSGKGGGGGRGRGRTKRGRGRGKAQGGGDAHQQQHPSYQRYQGSQKPTSGGYSQVCVICNTEGHAPAVCSVLTARIRACAREESSNDTLSYLFEDQSGNE